MHATGALTPSQMGLACSSRTSVGGVSGAAALSTLNQPLTTAH